MRGGGGVPANADGRYRGRGRGGGGEGVGDFLLMPMGGIGREREWEDIGSSDGREEVGEGDVLPHCRCLCGAQD